MEDTPVLRGCPRTEGDGMESLEGITQEPRSAGLNLTTNALLNLTLSPVTKPPERVISIQPKPSPPILANKSLLLPSSEKNAKFVPYEPYKAAVKPIVPAVKKKKALANSLSSPNIAGANQSLSDSSQQCNCSQEPYSELVKEIEKLKREKEEMATQLKLHNQVNTELKKLLVASVGEDMEARVHFLTEDKAKLADDIRRYVERIAVDFEQKEKLAIEADIWRSKFLASSVVIEELAKWKSVLCTRNDEMQICIKALMDEMNTLHCVQVKTAKQLKALNNAFDPLSSSGGKSFDMVHGDVISEAGGNLSLAESLSKRLLGAYAQVREETVIEQTQPDKLTSAQAAAHQMLTKKPAASCLMSELASEVTAHKVSSLARRSLNKSQFTCCSHCTGEVKTV